MDLMALQATVSQLASDHLVLWKWAEAHDRWFADFHKWLATVAIDAGAPAPPRAPVTFASTGRYKP